MSIRQETAKMIREMRNAGKKDGLRRPTFLKTCLCDNGQDPEMLIVRNEEMTVAEFKRFIDLLPDDAFIDLEPYTDYDGISLSAVRRVIFNDVAYHSYMQATHLYFLKQRGVIEVTLDGKRVF